MRSAFGKLFLALCIGLTVSSCGGGGGGGSDADINAANLSITVVPETFNVGDRTAVTIFLSDVNAAGILLKIRVPKNVTYAPSTAFLRVDDLRTPTSPYINDVSGEFRYLVFFFSQSQFDSGHNGDLELQLVGQAETDSGAVEADADINDPSVPDSSEFNITNPKFVAQDRVGIRVRGD